MSRLITAALVVLAGTLLAVAAPPADAAKRKPGKRPFVYVVVVDGLDGDAVEQGNAPFLSSLLQGRGARSTYFPNSSSVIPAETNPNHVAMMTGAFPGSSGIAANAFAIYAPLVSEDSCQPAGPFDFTIPPEPTSGESPTCPEAETLFETVKRRAARQAVKRPKSRVRRPLTAAIMGKPKLGRIFDVSWDASRAADYLWAPCDDIPEDDPYCADVDTNPITGYAASDTVVMDEVLRTITQGIEADARRRAPDFTFVNLPMVDSVGHALGRGAAYDTAVGWADAEIQRLVAALRETGRWDRSVLFVVSDHSMDTTPLKLNLATTLQLAGVPEDSFEVVGNGSVDFVYVANRDAAQTDELLARIRELALSQPGVDQALYRRPNALDGGAANTIDSAQPFWSAGERTGDVVVTTKPGYAFSDPGAFQNPLVGNHGAPQTADNFMAVTGNYPKIRQAQPEVGVSNADLAPTIAALLRMKPPRQSEAGQLRAAFKRSVFKWNGRKRR